jgi:hypothetical protein
MPKALHSSLKIFILIAFAAVLVGAANTQSDSPYGLNVHSEFPNADAEYEASQVYLNGTRLRQGGSSQGFHLGMLLLNDAAYHGSPRAQLDCARISSNLVDAYMWADVAALKGHPDARAYLARLNGSLSEAQLNEAREKANAWWWKHQFTQWKRLEYDLEDRCIRLLHTGTNRPEQIANRFFPYDEHLNFDYVYQRINAEASKALEHLSKDEKRGLIPFLIERLFSSDAHMQQLAADALRQIGKDVPETAPILVKVIEQNPYTHPYEPYPIAHRAAYFAQQALENMGTTARGDADLAKHKNLQSDTAKGKQKSKKRGT